MEEEKIDIDKFKEKDERPKLTDPKEFAIIRSIYFKDREPTNFDIDPLELLERQEQGKKRNQAR